MAAPFVIPSDLAGTPDLPLSALSVRVDLGTPSPAVTAQLSAIHAQWRAAVYLSVAQIFLKDNARLTRKLVVNDVKERLLGHFGTCPGIALAYTHLNALVTRQDDPEREKSFLFVTGVGHGAPAVYAELFIEGAFGSFDDRFPPSERGLERFVKEFSWPGGTPSHVNAETPGAIHEGGELGYALAVAYGSVFDKPDLITVVIVGDGESESGPTAAAWHSHKFLDPRESGAVLPILHVNGFKISERTIPGTMDEMELTLLYTGYGYQVRMVDFAPDGAAEANMGGNDAADHAIQLNMAVSMDWAHSEIRRIQHAARSGKPIDKPRWPLLIMRTPKGWTGPTATHGKQLLNNFASHQVPLPDTRKDPKSLALLEAWLKSYEPEQIFDDQAGANHSIFRSDVVAALPKDEKRRVGFARDAYAGYSPLELGDWRVLGDERASEVSAMKAIGAYLTDTIKRNPTTFRIFSPDELSSNKLDGVLEVTTRNFQPDPTTAHRGGRVTEMLSEHTLQGWMQGYTLTGRHSVFPSYESFLGIVATMLVQYAKFAKMAQETNWRRDIASLNYIETSTWTRQEHNGFSHQNPSFVATVIGLPTKLARVYFPADANTALSVIAHCIRSRNYVNLIVGAKNPTTNWLSVQEAEEHCIAGASVWPRYSTDEGINPDVVLVGCGVEMTFEVIAAAALLRRDFGSDLRVRVVNVVDLLVFAPVGDHPHALGEAAFNSLFPPATPIVVNYHGYPAQLRSLLFNRPHSVGRSRFDISGYSEQGTTTTPFSMMRVNGCGRFDITARALEMVATNFTSTGNVVEAEHKHRLGRVMTQVHSRIAFYLHQNVVHERYAIETQTDHPELSEQPSFE